MSVADAPVPRSGRLNTMNLMANIAATADAGRSFFGPSTAGITADEAVSWMGERIATLKLTMWLGYLIAVSTCVPLVFMVWPR